MELIAHRGASHDAPENTLASFALAWEQDAYGIETDVRLTRDGEIVCMHDPTTGRTGGDDLVVCDSSLAELLGLDVGAWKGAKWVGETVPTIEQVLAGVPGDKRILIEIKCGCEILGPLARTLERGPVSEDRIEVLCSDEEVLAGIRRELPEVKTVWLTAYRRASGGGWSPSHDVIAATLERTGAHGLGSMAHESVDAGPVSLLRRAGLEINIWTVDDPVEAERFRMLGVDLLTTNRPGMIREELSRHA